MEKSVVQQKTPERKAFPKTKLYILLPLVLIIGFLIFLQGDSISSNVTEFITYKGESSHSYLHQLPLDEIHSLSDVLETLKNVKRDDNSSSSNSTTTSHKSSSSTIIPLTSHSNSSTHSSTSSTKSSSSTTSSTLTTSSMLSSSMSLNMSNSTTPLIDQAGIRFSMVFAGFIVVNMIAIAVHHIFQKINPAEREYRSVNQSYSPF